MASTTTTSKAQRIRLWQTGRAMGHMLQAYPPGTDAMIDGIRSSAPLKQFFFFRVFMPFYFAREQGWVIRDERGAMAAILYLRQDDHEGIQVMHVDEISVGADYRGRGYARRLMQLAEELARAEGRPFLKLAVTVANTPAVTLYRRLGYEEAPHRYLTYQPATVLATSLPPTNLRLRSLDQGQAAGVVSEVYGMELRASLPALAPMLLAHYPVKVPATAQRMYAIDRGDQLVGYGVIDQREGRWGLRLGLDPALWGSEDEATLIQQLTRVLTDEPLGYAPGTPVALYPPSDAHVASLTSGPAGLATRLGLAEQSYERMVMAKVTTHDDQRR